MSAVIAVCIALGGAATSTVAAQPTMPLPGNGIIDITTSGGRVEIRGWDRAELSMDANDVFEVIRTSSGAQVRRMSGRRAGSTPLRLRVPAGSRVIVSGSSTDVDIADITGEVEVRITSGNVRLTQIGGRTLVSSFSGDIRLTGAGSDVRVRTASGDVTVRDVRGAVDVNTTSGDVDIFDARVRSLIVETMSGDIDFRGLVADDGTNRISTHSGDVRLSFPPDARALLELRTFSGRINSQRQLLLLPSASLDRRDATRRLQLGSAGGPVLAVTTFNGNIIVAHTGAPDQK